MRNWISGATMIVALTLGYSQRADASLFLDIKTGASEVTCDNGTAAGVTACTTAGFQTSLNANFINFGAGSGLTTLGGYNFLGGSGVTANVPGTPSVGLTSDSKLQIQNVSGASPLIFTFAAYGFTAPTGPNLVLSSSDTGNWTIAAGADVAGFKAWADPNNGTAPFVGTAANPPNCLSGGPGVSLSCSTASGAVNFTRLGTPYSLIGQESLTLAVGSQASFQATVVVSSVPEPVTFSLMGIGLLGIGLVKKRLL